VCVGYGDNGWSIGMSRIVEVNNGRVQLAERLNC